MEVDPQGVVALEHLAQLVVDALRQEDGHPRADAHDLDVGDLPEAPQDRLEQLGRERQAVTTADEHVAHLRRPAQVLQLRLVIPAVEVLGRVAHDPGPGAVAAVARALGRDEHQHPVGIAMDEPGTGEWRSSASESSIIAVNACCSRPSGMTWRRIGSLGSSGSMRLTK